MVDFATFQKGTAREQGQFVQQVGEALQQIGFFALINHGLAPALFGRLMRQQRPFFSCQSWPRALMRSRRCSGNGATPI
ncbi:MAG: 2-oxoglutarate and iron-dependent oxygenase domain-containing protein [Cyanobacteriota bacterium]